MGGKDEATCTCMFLKFLSRKTAGVLHLVSLVGFCRPLFPPPFFLNVETGKEKRHETYKLFREV